MTAQAMSSEEFPFGRRTFGTLADGQEAFLYTLTNASGLRAEITDFGAAVVSLLVPDRSGTLADVVLGYDSLDRYVNDASYLGVTVGRYANRIALGRFILEGKDYQVTVNDGNNHLHGGRCGFHKVLWTAVQRSGDNSLKLTCISPDGDEGYPGTVIVQVVYTLSDLNDLIIQYAGTTDRTTILNLAHHSYFNLTGSPATPVLDHHLRIDADSFTPVNRELITTGEVIPVEGTPMDFRTERPIRAHIDEAYDQLRYGNGYDHNWVLRPSVGGLRTVAEVCDPTSGRCLTIATDQPGLQFYSGNSLNGTIKGKGGLPYQRRSGLCLEAQHFPDSPNKPQFPSVILEPDAEYRQTTIYHFSAR